MTKNSVAKSNGCVINVMKRVNFQLCRTHSDGVIWKN